MSHSLNSDAVLLPFGEFDAVVDGPAGVVPSDPADYVFDWGADDFFVGRRNSASGSNEFSRAQPFGQGGLRIVDFDSETDNDEQIVAIGNSPVRCDADLPFCWECLHAEVEGSDSIEDFEWEDVSGRLVEQDIFCLTPFADDDDDDDDEDDDDLENESPNNLEGDVSEVNVDWEVLLSVNDNDSDSLFAEDQEGFAYASEYEVLFSQFGDHGGSQWMRCRATARSVVENLPSVQLTADDIAKENIYCAVCKDEVSLSEEVKGLPCLHFYHECCIVPWLKMRNTCPICRYELPSSDTNDVTIIDSEEAAQARKNGVDQEIVIAAAGAEGGTC